MYRAKMLALSLFAALVLFGCGDSGGSGSGGGSSTDNNGSNNNFDGQWEGMYEVTAHTENTEGCDASGATPVDEPFSHFKIEYDGQLGDYHNYNYNACTSQDSCDADYELFQALTDGELTSAVGTSRDHDRENSVCTWFQTTGTVVPTANGVEVRHFFSSYSYEEGENTPPCTRHTDDSQFDYECDRVIIIEGTRIGDP